MKRYETMSKKDIINLFVEVNEGACSECPVKSVCTSTGSCNDHAITYLQQEIEIKPRISVINNVEELEKAFKEYASICEKATCYRCKYKQADRSGSCDCFKNFLEEEIEVRKN